MQAQRGLGSASGAGVSAGGRKVRVTKKLYNDGVRRRQRGRFQKLVPQNCVAVGKQLYGMAKERAEALPGDVRVDLPSASVFAKVFGVYRCAAQLSKEPMVALELSVAEIAGIAGQSKAQVAAALRWMGSGPLVYRGRHVAVGLGVIARAKRKGLVLMDSATRFAYRTSITTLTVLGRALAGLAEVATEVVRGVAAVAKRCFSKKKNAGLEARGLSRRMAHGGAGGHVASEPAPLPSEGGAMTAFQEECAGWAERMRAKYG